MPELCQNCGAEFYEGQQFCRRCGTPVSAGLRPAGEAPTQLFPQEPALSTAQVGGETGRVGAGQATAYHAASNFQKTAPLVGQPFGGRPLAVEPPARRRGSRGAWVAALLVVFVLGAGLASGAAYVWWRATRGPVVAGKRAATVPVAPAAPAVPEMPAIPDVPADIGEQIREALKGVPLPLDESGAVVSGDTTTLTRTYEVDGDSAFAVHAFKGSVEVSGADGDQIVVRVVKRGGSAAERTRVRVLESKGEEGVSLLTAPSGPVSVSYEVSVPRQLRELKIEAEAGDVRVSGFAGTVVADVRAGDLEFRDVSGEVRSRLIKGNTKIFGAGAEREGSQQFTVVKGNIEATLAEGFGADLKAEVLDGEIDVDESFGLRVERAPAGRHVAGRVGEGGEALVFKVTDGDIRLRK
ncbi:MAG: DUF4097 family beta strand repeat-containing protein [Pyrinomonadaceae bacterium]